MRALVFEQKRAVDFLDVDPAILHPLEGPGRAPSAATQLCQDQRRVAR
jgi:hypothetical protein